MKVLIIVKILFILTIILILSLKGYRKGITIPIYPCNEVDKVKEAIKFRTQSDIDMFNLTDKSVSYAFSPIVNESVEELNGIFEDQERLILFFKNLINRPRPEQVDSSIVPLVSSTANTPAYPAGHAYQAYYLAKVLSKKYPDKKKQLYNIARMCDKCRVSSGIHYPSDGMFSKFLVFFLNF